MSLIELTDSTDSFSFKLDAEKVKLPDETTISLSSSYDSSHVYLGNQRIYSSHEENEARQFFEELRQNIEKGNYRLIIYPSFYKQIETNT